MKLITLTTDFGHRDTYVGQMKGAIYSIAPEARIVDLTHGIGAQDVVGGAVALDAGIDAFPDRAIHVAVVDPGVGSDRAAVAIETDRCTLIGPDNGLLSFVLDRLTPRRIVRLTNSDYHRHPVSATFHGRDIFAPAAAHLAAGVPLEALGETTDQLAALRLPQPQEMGEALVGCVLSVDHFGNLITSLREADVSAWLTQRDLDRSRVQVIVDTERVKGIGQTFADAKDGQPVVYLGSGGRLEVAVRNGDAAAHFKARPGVKVALVKP